MEVPIDAENGAADAMNTLEVVQSCLVVREIEMAFPMSDTAEVDLALLHFGVDDCSQDCSLDALQAFRRAMDFLEQRVPVASNYASRVVQRWVAPVVGPPMRRTEPSLSFTATGKSSTT